MKSAVQWMKSIRRKKALKTAPSRRNQIKFVMAIQRDAIRAAAQLFEGDVRDRILALAPMGAPGRPRYKRHRRQTSEPQPQTPQGL